MNNQIQFWVYGDTEKELLFKTVDTNTFEGVYRAWINRYGDGNYQFSYKQRWVMPTHTPKELNMKNDDIILCLKEVERLERG